MTNTDIETQLPYPERRDDVGDHPAYSDDHYIEQEWVHFGQPHDVDGKTVVEYDHSEPRFQIRDSDNEMVVKSDTVVNLERKR